MMRILILIVFCLLPLLSHAADTRGLRVIAKDPASGQQSEVSLYNKSYAVIIGIDQYQNLPADRQLSYAVKDAKGVAQVLAKNYRFDKIVTLYNKDATKEQIMKLLTVQLPKEIGKNDSLFVFWAGHGNQELTPEGEIGFLIPYDGSADEVYRNVTMTEIRDTVSRIVPAKHVFYAMDACYSGLLTTRAVDSKPRRDLAYLKEITKERVRQVLTAGGRDQQVLDGGPNGHSVFTGRLIEILEASGDFITANEIQSILKERVFNDAKGRGYVQTPSFGSLSGNGDFVFVPNIQQKVQDNKAELAKLEAELKQLEVREAEAKKIRNQQQQREAEQLKKTAEAKLRAEQLRQQQLADEAKRQQEMVLERARFEAAQKQQEQERIAAQRIEEQRLSALKSELAKKKQAVPVVAAGSLAVAVAEVKRLNAEIAGIEATFCRELTSGRERINVRYDKEIAAVRAASQQKQAPLVRDEFETAAEFQVRQAKYEQRFDERISQLQAQQQQELDELQKRLDKAQHEQTKELRQSLRQLGDKTFTIGLESLVAELGNYDVDKQFFPVSITSGIPEIKLAMNGVIPLSRDAARSFKQQWQARAVRPLGEVTAGGTLKSVALVNDADGVVRECRSGSCMTNEERVERERLERKRLELEKLIYTDPKTGLQWLSDANVAGKRMTWDGAMQWVKTLNVAGYSDWRLPTKDELVAFAKQGRNRPADYFNVNGFSSVESNNYWSSSTYSGISDSAWFVSMFDGYVSHTYKYYNGEVWPVRDAK